MSKVASWLRQLLRSWLTPPISSRVNSQTLPTMTAMTTNSTTTGPADETMPVDLKKSVSILQNTTGDSLTDRRVFVAKMSRNVNYIMLRTHMSQAGEVKKSFVYRYANGLSTGRGFVEYCDSKTAQSAVSKLSGTKLTTMPIVLEKFSKDIDEDAGVRVFNPRPKPNPAATVIVSNLKHSLDQWQLYTCFKSAGKVLHTEISIDSEGKSTGIGFVQYETTDQALKAVALFHGQILWGLPMNVRMDCRSPLQPDPLQLRMAYAMGMMIHNDAAESDGIDSSDPISQQLRSIVSSFSALGRRLTIKNIPCTTTKSELHGLLSKAGKPLVVTINKREKSAFVLYETCDDAHKAIELFDKSLMDGKRIELVDYVD